jgi:uncharacterized membrane protein (DUF485 family)
MNDFTTYAASDLTAQWAIAAGIWFYALFHVVSTVLSAVYRTHAQRHYSEDTERVKKQLRAQFDAAYHP